MKKIDKIKKENAQKFIKLIQSNTKNDQQMLKYLMTLKKSELNVDERDGAYNTLLILCANRNYMLTLTELLKIGANPNLFSMHGYTPLCWAGSDNLLEMARLLIEYGADKSLRNSHNESPIENAIGNGHIEVTTYLISLLPDIDEVNKLKEKMIEFKSNSKVLDKIQRKNTSNEYFEIINKSIQSRLLYLLLEEKLNTNEKKQAIKKI